MKPFLRWVGGKTQLLDVLRPLVLPDRLYFEPFLGGGALFFDVRAGQEAQLNDANAELIKTYQVVRDYPDFLIAELSDRVKYANNEATYYARRSDPRSTNVVERAARFIYLNRTSFNGVHRVNKNGDYNVPFGHTSWKGVNGEELVAASHALRLTTLHAGNYMVPVGRGAFVYLDPPYVPKSPSANFTSYTAEGFGEARQLELIAWAERLDATGAHVVISNADVPWVREHYKNFHLIAVDARRSINSKITERKAVGEVIAVGRTLLKALEGTSAMAPRKKKIDPTPATPPTPPPAPAAEHDLAQVPIVPTVTAPATPSTGILPAFNRIDTNVKAGAAADLSPLVAIVGNNKAGKTSIIDAMRLAINGRHPVGVHMSDLLELAPNGSDKIEVSLLSPVGSVFFTAEKGKPIQHEFHGALKVLDNDTVRVHALPSLLMRSFISGDSKARQHIFARFGGGAAAGGLIPEGLNPEQTALWHTGWSESAAVVTKKNPAPTDDLILTELVGWMRRAKLEAGRRIKSDETRVEELEAQASNAGAEQLPALEELYTQALAAEAQSGSHELLERKRGLLAQVNQQARDFIDRQPEFDALIESINTTVQQAQARIAELEAQKPDNVSGRRIERLRVVIELLDAALQAGHTVCPVCVAGADLAARKAFYEQRLAQAEKSQEGYLKATTEIAGCQELIRTAEADVKRHTANREANRASIKNAAATLKAEIADLEAVVRQPYTGPSSTVLKQQIDAIRVAVAVQDQIADVKKTIRQTKTMQETAKRLEGEADDILQALVRRISTSVETAVNKYMPTGFVAKLDMSDGGCEWKAIGGDGRAHNRHTMSGAEMSTLLIALALAWTDGAPLRVLLLDDADVGPFHSTPANLRALLQRLSDAVAAGQLSQVVVAGIREDEVPTGWQVIKR